MSRIYSWMLQSTKTIPSSCRDIMFKDPRSEIGAWDKSGEAGRSPSDNRSSYFVKRHIEIASRSIVVTARSAGGEVRVQYYP